MEQFHAEEERLTEHIKYKHNMSLEDYGFLLRMGNTWDVVEDFWKFHRNLHDGKCISCEKEVKEKDFWFYNNVGLKKFKKTGLCWNCQATKGILE